MQCQNCLAESEILQKVKGWWACPECVVKAELPPHLRSES